MMATVDVVFWLATGGPVAQVRGHVLRVGGRLALLSCDVRVR